MNDIGYEKNYKGFIELCKYTLKNGAKNVSSYYISLLIRTYEGKIINESIIQNIAYETSEYFKDFFNTCENDTTKYNNLDFINKTAEGFLKIISTSLYYERALYTNTYIINIEKGMTTYEESIKNTYDEYKNHFDEQKQKMETFIQNIYEKNGLAEFGSSYDEECEKLSNAKELWLIFSSFFAIGIFSLACVFFSEGLNMEIKSRLNFAYIFTMKFFILGILFFAMSWCAKMYSLTRQQELVYKNKGLITKTYNSFMEGAKDKETRETIIASAATELFTLSNTGFVPGKESNLDVLEQTTKIVTALVSKAKPTRTS